MSLVRIQSLVQMIVQTRKCDADKNRFSTKNNMSPSPEVGGHNKQSLLDTTPAQNKNVMCVCVYVWGEGGGVIK